MKSANVTSNTLNILAPRGRGCPKGAGEGVSPMACVSPSSVLRTSSPSRGEVNSGFTLIELLVVVLIIGILAAVAVPQYQVAVAKSRYMDLLIAGDAISKAEEIYYLANGTYTSNLSALDISADIATKKSGGVDVNGAYQGHAALEINSHVLNMSYVIYLQHNKQGPSRWCRVKDNSKPYLKQVCESITGKGCQAGSGSIIWNCPF